MPDPVNGDALPSSMCSPPTSVGGEPHFREKPSCKCRGRNKLLKFVATWRSWADTQASLPEALQAREKGARVRRR